MSCFGLPTGVRITVLGGLFGAVLIAVPGPAIGQETSPSARPAIEAEAVTETTSPAEAEAADPAPVAEGTEPATPAKENAGNEADPTASAETAGPQAAPSADAAGDEASPAAVEAPAEAADKAQVELPAASPDAAASPPDAAVVDIDAATDAPDAAAENAETTAGAAMDDAAGAAEADGLPTDEEDIVYNAGIVLNMDYVEKARAEQYFDIEDTLETFAYVLGSLPEQVTVYPTENYFYFSFFYGGMEYSGNIRLDVSDRDDGIVHFAYFSKTEPWNMELLTRYKPLSAQDGVTVEKIDELIYQISYNGISVEFQLNDLSDVVPPKARVAPQEDYLGPVFDESGVEFYFLFDRTLRQFRFVLNETGTQSDILVPYSQDTPVILVGMRTGFVFFDDRRQDRRLLIGVNRINVDANNYFDGPFDQLPDNFIEGEELRDAILAKHPSLRGEIGRLGGFKGQDGRFLVNPYVNYYQLRELDAFYRCIDPNLDRDAYYQCLAPPDPDAGN